MEIRGFDPSRCLSLGGASLLRTGGSARISRPRTPSSVVELKHESIEVSIQWKNHPSSSLLVILSNTTSNHIIIDSNNNSNNYISNVPAPLLA